MQPDCAYGRPSPQEGGSLHQCERDFCEGAKGLNSLPPPPPPPFSTSIINEFTDAWAEIHDPLFSENLEVFNDVILPSDEYVTEFGTDLLDNIELSKFEQDYNTCYEINNSSSFSQIQSEAPKSNFTIKLKKIKFKNINKPGDISRTRQLFPVDTFDIAAPGSETKINGRNGQLQQSPLVSFFDSVPEADVSFASDSSSSLTLKEVFKMNDSDTILASYLDSQGNSPSDNIHEPASSPIWDDVQSCSLYDTSFSDMCNFENSSILSSIKHYSPPFTLGSPSPSYSPSSESSLSYVSEIPFSHQEVDCTTPITTVAPTTARSKSQKVKKSRQKMSQESRYLRKKEQNKQAALRYRAKKKQEIDEIQHDVQKEEERLEELEDTYSKLRQEVALMKKLMREVCISKKLVLPNAFE